MNAFWSGLIDQAFCVRLTETLLLFLSEGAAIGVAAFLTSRSLRNRSPQHRYVVHVTSMLLMVLCLPVTFALMPARQTAEPPLATVPETAAADRSPSTAVDAVILPARPDLGSIAQPGLPQAPGLSAVDAEPMRSPEVSESLLPVAPAPSTWIEQSLQLSAPYAVFAYFAGVGLMLVRLLAAFYGGHRLRKRSTPIRDRQLLVRIRRQARRLGLKAVPVVAYCERIAIPVVIGAVKPMILLPAWIATGLAPDQLQAILAHEMAHIRRFDLVVNVLQRVIETVLFFHPAVWYVSRRIDVERENCCDDMAIRSGHTTLTYADALVRMAELSARRLRPEASARLAALAVDGNNGTQLKRRVLRLLGCEGQFRLSHSDSFTLLLAAVLVVVTLAGLWHPASANSQLDSESIAAAPEDAAEADAGDAAADSESSKELRISGTVVGPDGQPVQDAAVQINWTHSGDLSRASYITRRISEVRTDRNGRFASAIDRQIVSQTYFGRTGRKESGWLNVVARKPGFGLSVQTIREFEIPKPVELRLAAEQAIQGRLLNTEGQPVQGIAVEIDDLAIRSETPTAAAADSPSKSPSGEMPKPVSRGPTVPGYRTDAHGQLANAELPSGVTDRDGRFQLSELPSDSELVLRIHGPGIATSQLNVAARPEPTRRNSGETIQSTISRQNVHYGAQFDHIVEAGVFVEGTIKDVDDGAPLAGARIVTEEIAGRRMAEDGFLSTVTDASGHYRLDGLPVAPGTRLRVIPKDQPYLITDNIQVPRSENLQPIKLDVAVKKVLWATGRVTVGDTGKPVAGVVYYSPFRSNPTISGYQNLADGRGHILNNRREFATDAEGRFRIPVIPGRGVIAFQADDDRYRNAVGIDAFPKSDFMGSTQVLNTCDHIFLTSVNLVAEINPPKDAVDAAVDLRVDPGLTTTLVLLDEHRQPLNGVRVHGARSSGSWDTSSDNRVKLSGLAADVPRLLICRHEATGKATTLKLVPKAEGAEQEVIVGDPAVVTGRLVDQDDRPVPRRPVSPGLITDSGHMQIEGGGSTDEKGNLEVRLPQGGPYEVNCGPGPYHTLLRTKLDVTAGEHIELGELTIDPDKPRQPAKPKAEEKRTPAASKQDASASKATEARPLHFAGTIVDESGKPVEGAKVSLAYWRGGNDGQQIDEIAVTGKDGGFDAIRARSDFKGKWNTAWPVATCLVTKPGLGLGASLSMNFETTGQQAAAFSEEERERARNRGLFTGNRLTLPADLPVRGRIVTTEGVPVVGALVEPFCADEGQSGSLDAWEAATRKPGANYYSARQELRDLFGGDLPMRPFSSILPTVRTDENGWFTLSGLGRERMAHVVVSGPGIEASVLRVRSRKGEPIKLAHSDQGDRDSFDTWYPAEFTHVAGPSQRIEGTVTDRKTGKPVAGALIESGRQGAGWVSGNAGLIRSRTDENGHYELDGFPLGENEFSVSPPNGASWLGAIVTVRTKAEREPLVRNVTLTPGVLVHGTITDGSGKLVPGTASYFAFSDNPATKEAKGFNAVPVRSDGHFEIAVLPGAGLVTFNAEDHETYPRGEGAAMIRQKPSFGVFNTTPMSVMPMNYHGLIPVDPAEGSAAVDVQLKLTALASFSGRVIDGSGKEVDHYALLGERIPGSTWYEHQSAVFRVRGYQPQYGRRVMAYHRESDSIGLKDVIGEAPKAIEVKLQPAARFKGRLIDEDGMPVAGMQINSAEEPIDGPKMISHEEMWAGKFDPERAHFAAIHSQLVLTDDQGRFEIVGVMPGLKYNGHAYGTAQSGNRKYFTRLGAVFTDVVAKGPGGHDLGDVKIISPKPRMQKPDAADQTQKPSASAGGSKAAADMVTVNGVVLLPDGQPASEAKVRAAGPVWEMMKPVIGESFRPEASETTADSRGQFSISFSSKPFGDVSRLDAFWQEIWKQTQIVASMPGFGPQWATYKDVEGAGPVTLKLVEDQVLSGRVIGLEGQPLANVPVRIVGIGASADENLDVWLKHIAAGEPPWISHKYLSRHVEHRLAGIPETVTTDAQGRFEIRGIGKERRVNLLLSSEQVALREFEVLTRPMAAVPHVYRPGWSKTSQQIYGAEFTVTGMPARVIEGVVRDVKTKEPLADVGVESETIADGLIGNMRTLKTRTDAQGRFRLAGMPKGKGNSLQLRPNDDQPYFMQSFDVKDTPGLEAIQLDLGLTRGIWIKGRITDRATHEPVPAVRVHYLPFRNNELVKPLSPFRDGDINEDQSRYVSAADGTYRVVGYADPAIVGVQAVMQSYRVGVGFENIKGPKYENREVFDTYMNPVWPSARWPSAMRQIDPALETDSVTLDFELDPGATIKLKLVDRDQQPVTGATVIGQTMSGAKEIAQSHMVEIRNLGPDDSRTVAIDQKDRLIGRTVRIVPEDVRRGVLTVELQPYAVVTGRLLTNDVPIKGMEIQASPLPAEEFQTQLPSVVTDEEGRFRLNAMPGANYSINASDSGLISYISKDVGVESGKVIDLGTFEKDKNLGFVPLASTESASAPVPASK